MACVTSRLLITVYNWQTSTPHIPFFVVARTVNRRIIFFIELSTSTGTQMTLPDASNTRTMAQEFFRFLDCAEDIATAKACEVLDGLSKSKSRAESYIQWILEDGSIVRRDHRGDGFYSPKAI
jgi:hypothetical protein